MEELLELAFDSRRRFASMQETLVNHKREVRLWKNETRQWSFRRENVGGTQSVLDSRPSQHTDNGFPTNGVWHSMHESKELLPSFEHGGDLSLLNKRKVSRSRARRSLDRGGKGESMSPTPIRESLSGPVEMLQVKFSLHLVWTLVLTMATRTATNPSLLRTDLRSGADRP